MSIQETMNAEERFAAQFNPSNEFEEEVATHNSANTVAIVRDWDEWTNELNFQVEFGKTPTGITARSIGSDTEIDCYVFSSGGNAAYLKKEVVEAMSEVLGYDMKSNLEKLILCETKNGPVVAQGDGFRAIMAPWLPPSDL